MGTRQTSNVLSTTTLEFQLLRNGQPYSAESVRQVTIHSSYDSAANNLNIIQTIDSSNILEVDTGLYRYTVDIIPDSGTYYDKIFLTPSSVYGEVTFINSFVISGDNIFTPGAPDTCVVAGFIIDGTNNPITNTLVSAIPSEAPAILKNTGRAVAPVIVETMTTSTGAFGLSLLRNAEFIITIKEIGYKEKIRVPDEDVYSLWGVAPIGEIDDTSNDTTDETQW